MGKRFVYTKMDKVAENSILTHGVMRDPMRECDHCKKPYRGSELYALTPLDFSEWLKESGNLDTLKEFGLVRCKDCLPADAISGDEHYKSPRDGWQHVATVHSKERDDKDTEKLAAMVNEAIQKYREKDALEFNKIGFMIKRRFDLNANVHSEKKKSELSGRQLLEWQAGVIINLMDKATLLREPINWDEVGQFF